MQFITNFINTTTNFESSHLPRCFLLFSDKRLIDKLKLITELIHYRSILFARIEFGEKSCLRKIRPNYNVKLFLFKNLKSVGKFFLEKSHSFKPALILGKIFAVGKMF